jgi:hypothetical protein
VLPEILYNANCNQLIALTKGGLLLDDYELASKLRSMYENARRNEAVCQINLFGIKYAQEIKRSGRTVKQLVELSGINKGYVTEISKGIKLSKFVVLKEKGEEG